MSGIPELPMGVFFGIICRVVSMNAKGWWKRLLLIAFVSALAVILGTYFRNDSNIDETTDLEDLTPVTPKVAAIDSFERPVCVEGSVVEVRETKTRWLLFYDAAPPNQALTILVPKNHSRNAEADAKIIQETIQGLEGDPVLVRVYGYVTKAKRKVPGNNQSVVEVTNYNQMVHEWSDDF